VDVVESNPRPDPAEEGPLHSPEGPEPPAGDGAGAEEGGTALEGGKDPLRFSNWMKRSATGAVMTGIAVGLKEALQSKTKEVPFVIEARGEPDDPDKPIDLRFDPDSPADTVAIIRRPPTGAGPDGPSPTP
jgi:hypothetical protein